MGSREATAGLEREGSGATCTGAPAREGAHQRIRWGIQPRTQAQGRGPDDKSTTGGDLSQSGGQVLGISGCGEVHDPIGCRNRLSVGHRVRGRRRSASRTSATS